MDTIYLIKKGFTAESQAGLKDMFIFHITRALMGVCIDHTR